MNPLPDVLLFTLCTALAYVAGRQYRPRPRYWVLDADDGEPVQCAGGDWSQWTGNRCPGDLTVAASRVGPAQILTLFVGVDPSRNASGGPWHTIIRGGPLNGCTWMHDTRALAEAFHRRLVLFCGGAL